MTPEKSCKNNHQAPDSILCWNRFQRATEITEACAHMYVACAVLPARCLDSVGRLCLAHLVWFAALLLQLHTFFTPHREDQNKHTLCLLVSRLLCSGVLTLLEPLSCAPHG